MFRWILVAALILAPGCIAENHWERFTWQESTRAFHEFPAPGERGGFTVTRDRWTDRMDHAGVPLRSLPLNSTALDGRWTGEFALLRVGYGTFILEYSGSGSRRDAAGTRHYVPQELQIWCSLRSPSTLQEVRASFVSFVLNTTTASRAAANAWAEETFPNEYETRIRTNTNPSASYEFNAFTPVPYDLRLDALADELQLATRPEQAETGPAVLDANGWTFEFSLTSNVAREDGRFGDLQLTIDSAGHAYFGRHGLDSIGGEMLESELHDAFQSLGLTGPAAVRRTYEHDSYRD